MRTITTLLTGFLKYAEWRKPFGVFVFALLFSMLPPTAFGAILYEKSDTSSNVTFNNNGTTGKVVYDPMGTGTGNYSQTTGGGGTFYTTTTTVTTIRVERVSGLSCSTLGQSGAVSVLLSPWVSPNVYSNTGVSTSGNYCDFTVSIPSGVGLGAVSLSPSADGDVILKGNVTTGRSYDPNNVYQAVGGFAFQLCSLSTCGDFTPIESSITLTSPTSQTYVNNPITWVTPYYMNGSTCYKEISYQTEWLNSSSSPIFQANQSPYSFTSCQTANSAVATSSYNLPYQGNWRTRARLTSFNIASSTAWTSWQYFGLGATSTATTSVQIGGFVPQDCGAFDVACGFSNALGWAFIPSPEVTNQFSSLTLENSMPFSYFYDVPNVVATLFGSSATTTMEIKITGLHFVPNSTSSITLLSSEMIEAVPYSSTIRTLLGYIIWFMFGLLVYRQVINIHNK